MNAFDGERKKLRQIQAVFEHAVEKNSINDLRPHIDDEFSYVSFTDRAFYDFESFEKQWALTRAELVGSGSYITRLTPKPTIFSGDIAIAHGNSQNNMVDKNGDSYSFESNWTVVFRKHNDEWKVLRAHNSLDPFGNPMLTAGVKRKVTKYGIGAFVLGGVAGVLLCFLI